MFASADVADPALNGGPTETMAIAPEALPSTPAPARARPATDQRGKPRFGTVDIGAYELQPDIFFADGFD